jgi:hypothetical protein
VKKIARGHATRARFAGEHDLRIERDTTRGPFRRRVGQRQAAAEGAAVADCRVRDVLRGVGQQGQMLLDVVGCGDGSMRGERTDVHMAILHADAGVLVQAADVDQQFGRGQPHIERGHQALSAGQKLRRVAVALEQIEHLGEAACPCVGKRRGFHRHLRATGANRAFTAWPSTALVF